MGTKLQSIFYLGSVMDFLEAHFRKQLATNRHLAEADLDESGPVIFTGEDDELDRKIHEQMSADQMESRRKERDALKEVLALVETRDISALRTFFMGELATARAFLQEIRDRPVRAPSLNAYILAAAESDLLFPEFVLKLLDQEERFLAAKKMRDQII